VSDIVLTHKFIGPIIFCYLALVVSACGGGGGSAAPDAEASTERYFEKIRGNAALERAFLYRMPKGGDIHNHLSGAILAESYIGWAADLNYCVCVNKTCGTDTQYTIKTPSQSPPACDSAAGLAPIAQSTQDPNFYNAMIDALSMRNFVPKGSGERARSFFNTFAKFGAISGIKTGPMLAEVASIWHAENVKYVELMLSLDGGASTRALVSGMTWDPTQMQRLFSFITSHPAFPGYINQGTTDLNKAEAEMRSTLGCGTTNADPACDSETIRYIYSMNRTQQPIQVFATAVYAFELAAADHRMIGVNLVAPEDNPVALRDYLTQMQIFGFLSQAVPGVKISLHAGELTAEFAPPPDLLFHIRAAVETGQALRIGHGVDIKGETAWPQLMAQMAEEQRLVEICLTSNDSILQVVGPDHPFETYRSNGVPLALATDDAGVSRIDLTHEYQRAADTYQLRYSDLKELARNSLEYDFLPGKSLWKSTVPFIRADECRRDAPRARVVSAPCQNLLNSSERARQQWQLEGDYASFEHSIARARSAVGFTEADTR
jgi:adenosine deaminase/adenosine deaminase CECR1